MEFYLDIIVNLDGNNNSLKLVLEKNYIDILDIWKVKTVRIFK